jgi:hypothetical protein
MPHTIAFIGTCIPIERSLFNLRQRITAAGMSALPVSSGRADENEAPAHNPANSAGRLSCLGSATRCSLNPERATDQSAADSGHYQSIGHSSSEYPFVRAITRRRGPRRRQTGLKSLGLPPRETLGTPISKRRAARFALAIWKRH